MRGQQEDGGEAKVSPGRPIHVLARARRTAKLNAAITGRRMHEERFFLTLRERDDGMTKVRVER